MNAHLPIPEPIEIDPRSCEHCGLTIDQHFRVDTFEGPEYFCQPIEVLMHLHTAQQVRQWEMDDPRDRWRHTGEKAPSIAARNSDIGAKHAPPRPYVTPEATVNAFLYVARNHDAAYLARWLEQHPQDIATLTKLWEAKNGHF
jgi:hypothetical protein